MHNTHTQYQSQKGIRLLWGYPGWGWRMYGIASFAQGKMWFIGFSRQLPAHNHKPPPTNHNLHALTRTKPL
jgi:hypothetical protein